MSVSTPSWIDITTDVRSAECNHGRDSSLSEFDAGTATIVLDNRDRAYDPLNNSAIKPMNRVWLVEEFSGERHDLFKGYVTSWGQAWPGTGSSDAEATASCQDEFLVLSQAALPTTSPPRESYAALIASDNPDGYWEMSEDSGARTRVSTDPVILPMPRVGGVMVPATIASDRRGDLRRNMLKAKRKR